MGQTKWSYADNWDYQVYGASGPHHAHWLLSIEGVSRGLVPDAGQTGAKQIGTLKLRIELIAGSHEVG